MVFASGKDRSNPAVEWHTNFRLGSAPGSYLQYFGTGHEELRAAMRAINPSVFIRIPFQVADPAGITDLVLSAQWEDGIVAYLNGTEVYRERAPATPAWNSTSIPASGRDETLATSFLDYPLTSGNLVAGTNVLAIHGLNDSAGSSDFLISPRLRATQRNIGNLVDGYFPDPTPGTENTIRYDGIVADTQFSVDRGSHTAPINLEITSETEGAEIRYSTNGTPPTETSGLTYTGPITISTTTVIRAMAHKPGFRSTNVDTHTYNFASSVYGPTFAESLTAVPTISLVTQANYNLPPSIPTPPAGHPTRPATSSSSSQAPFSSMGKTPSPSRSTTCPPSART